VVLSCLEAILATLGLVTFGARVFGFFLGIISHLPPTRTSCSRRSGRPGSPPGR
jgi:hypothetical protein